MTEHVFTKYDAWQYTYDSASNRLTNTAAGNEQTITMGLVTKPEIIKIGTASNAPEEKFFYGLGSPRYLRVHADGRKTFYLGGVAGGEESPTLLLRP